MYLALQGTEVPVPRVHVALEPVVGRAASVLRDEVRVACGSAIDLRAFQQDLAQSEQLRAMWIAGGIGENDAPVRGCAG